MTYHENNPWLRVPFSKEIQFEKDGFGKSKIVDSILNNNNENIITMNIFDVVRSNDISNTITSGMPYAECSQIFRGSDV